MSPRSLWRGVRRLVRSREADAELSEEVDQLFAMTVEDLMRRGFSRGDAERAVRLQLGNPEVIKDTVRDAGWESRLDTLWRDVCYALRGLQRNPAFTFAAVVTLTLGIGATTTMFSVVNGVMLRPLPYQDSRRLTLLWTEDARRGLRNEGTAYPTIADWKRDSRAFEDIAFFTTERATMATPQGRQRTRIALTSPNVFSVLGVSPLHGRWLLRQDMQRGESVAVISASL